MAELTPMMQQYFEIKERYKDCITVWAIFTKCSLTMPNWSPASWS